MKVALVKVGNSRGIRIPKPIIEQCQFGEEVNLEVHDHSIIISPVSATRQGWSQQFKEMRQNQDDALLDLPVTNDWDEKEWEWV